MSATEEVIEQIPEAVLEDTVEVVNVVRNNPYVLLGVALIGGSLGAFGGYKLAQKRLRMYYKDIADQEIQEAKEYYSHLRVKASDPEDMLLELHGETAVVEAAVAAQRRYAGEVAETPADSEEELLSPDEKALHDKHGVSHERDEIVTTRRRTFEGRVPVNEDNFILAEETLLRTGEKPYVITHDEYYENDKDYEQVDMTYFQGDDILVDSRDQVVPDEDSTVGNDNLTRFGHGSKDANIVYVRNENLECDFEITRSNGKYSVEIMGLDDPDENTLRHSAHSGGPRRFRQRDE